MGIVVGTMFAILFAALAGGMWIGLTLGATGAVLLAIFRDIPLDKLLAQYAWNILTTQELLALPMFILMGEILFRTRLSRSLFQGLAPWAGLLPGRLLHVNVIGCSIFAAISGSSAATTQVVGRMSLDRAAEARLFQGHRDRQARRRRHARLPDPAVEHHDHLRRARRRLDPEAVHRGLHPGLPARRLLHGLGHDPHRRSARAWCRRPSATLRKLSMLDRIKALKELAPAMFLIASVLGSMYGGIATPSEGAAVGVLGALIVAALQGGLTLQALRDIAIGSVLTCSMIAMIVLGASILGSAAAFLGIPRAVAEFVAGMGLSPFMLIVALIVFYLILGCFLDGFSMIVMTLPIVLPIVKQAGFDPIWFGIFLVLVVEMAQITPPVGFNLFVIQGLTDDGLGYIAKVTLPYLHHHGAVHAGDHGFPSDRAVSAQSARRAIRPHGRRLPGTRRAPIVRPESSRGIRDGEVRNWAGGAARGGPPLPHRRRAAMSMTSRCPACATA